MMCDGGAVGGTPELRVGIPVSSTGLDQWGGE